MNLSIWTSGIDWKHQEEARRQQGSTALLAPLGFGIPAFRTPGGEVQGGHRTGALPDRPGRRLAPRPPCHVHGQTDEFGYNIVRDPVHVHDLHATMQHLLGVDHERQTFKFQGRYYRLTDVADSVVKGVIASVESDWRSASVFC